MRVPQLQVQTMPARIGIKKNDAVHEYQQFKADQSIEQPKADLMIRQRPGKLTIDQSKAWSNLHLKSSFERTRDTAAFAEQTWMEGLARVAQEGDELMKIENKGNPIADQAARNVGFNFDYKPGNTPVHELVQTSYEANPTEIDVKRNAPIIKTTPRFPEFQYQRGSVDVTMEQYPSVQIDWKL
ncbi:hypothetical protein EQV77_13000 [Halobacillus fulvus]|nr:hypothetical protein EQV77_13000 [Halobacillus fulvus]